MSKNCPWAITFSHGCTCPFFTVVSQSEARMDTKHGRQIIMYVLEWRTVSALQRGLFLCLFPNLRSNEGHNHKNNTRMGAETVLDESTYIILFLTRHNGSIDDDQNDDLYISSPCLTRSVFVLLMTSQSIVDDATITRQFWRDYVNNDI